MSINRNNYEEYFLDFIEKNLNSDQIEELRSFLTQNPDLEKELDDFEQIKLIPDEVLFSEKELIKKPPDQDIIEINDSNFSYFSISIIEKNLNTKQVKTFEDYLSKQPEKRKEFDLFKKSVLHPDKKIKFSDKEILLKKEKKKGIVRTLLPYFSAAASILIFFGIYNSIKDYSRSIDNEKDIFDSELVLEKLDYNIPENNNIGTVEETIEEPDALKEDTIGIKNVKPPVVQKVVPISNQKSTISETVKEEESVIKEKMNIPERKKRRIPSPRSIYSPRQKLLTDTEMRVAKPKTDTEEEYMTALQYVGKEFKKRVLKKNDPYNEKLTFWDIADVGFKGYNMISGKDAKLKRKYNSEGKLTNIGLDTESYQLQTRVRK